MKIREIKLLSCSSLWKAETYAQSSFSNATVQSAAHAHSELRCYAHSAGHKLAPPLLTASKWINKQLQMFSFAVYTGNHQTWFNLTRVVVGCFFVLFFKDWCCSKASICKLRANRLPLKNVFVLVSPFVNFHPAQNMTKRQLFILPKVHAHLFPVHL